MATQHTKLRDKVGPEHSKVLMQDTRQADSDLIYCDIIICNDDIAALKLATQELDKELIMDGKMILIDSQLDLCWPTSTDVFVTINVYQLWNVRQEELF